MKRKSQGVPSGFRDLLPEEAKVKAWLVKTIKEVYQKWGFLPIETPAVEFTETLVGEVTDFNLFNVAPSKERQTGKSQGLSLRFDHTVPLARFVVDNMSEITFPFKRFVTGSVFRGEAAQVDKGRFRQFDQFDIDIVGSSNIASDVEVILCMRDTMRAIVGEKFVIKVNTRKLLNCLPELFQFDKDKLKDVLIELDKRDKVSQKSLIESIKDIGIGQDEAMKLAEFGMISGDRDDVLTKVKNLFKNISSANEAISDLETINQALKVCNAKEIIFDMSVIRGLGYYTGTVFETNLLEAPAFGAVYSGGRYDGLLESFGVQALPAVGSSAGIDRMVAALMSIDFKVDADKKKVIVLPIDQSVTPYAFRVAERVREVGYVCEVYTGNKKKLSDRFTYADKLGYDYTLIVGEDEEKNETINIRNQKTKEQKTLSLSELKNFE